MIKESKPPAKPGVAFGTTNAKVRALKNARVPLHTSIQQKNYFVALRGFQVSFSSRTHSRCFHLFFVPLLWMLDFRNGT